jgi:sugar (pentulose or hexulose) kinase
MSVIGPARMNARAMNAGTGGVTFPLPIVMSAAQRSDIFRSVLESIAFAIRANLEQAEVVAEKRVAMLHFGGGMARSAVLTQSVADVTGRPVRLASTHETSAVGAAMLAFVATGTYRSPGDAVAAMAGGRRTIEPNPRSSTEYEDLYARWLAMCESFEALA